MPFTLNYSVRSAGTRAAEDVIFSLSLPEGAGLTLESASAEGASCSVAGLNASCDFGTLAAGEKRAREHRRAWRGGGQCQRAGARDLQQ